MNVLQKIAELNAHGQPTKMVAPEISYLPSGVFVHDLAAAARIDQEQAAEDAERHQAAIQAAQARADAEYDQSLYVRLQPWREGPVPAATELGCDVSGLQPARASLVRFAAWSAETTAELRKLELARENFLDQIGAPKVSQAELDRIEAEDRSGMMAWLRRGASKAEKPTIDEFRRQAVQERLAQQTYTASVAREALSALEGEIDLLRAVVAELSKRHQRCAQAALAEEGMALVAEYAGAVEHVRRLAANLAGLARACPGHDVHRGPLRQAAIDVPIFGTVRGRLVVDEREIDQAAAPWQERVKQLMVDPRAQILEKE